MSDYIEHACRRCGSFLCREKCPRPSTAPVWTPEREKAINDRLSAAMTGPIGEDFAEAKAADDALREHAPEDLAAAVAEIKRLREEREEIMGGVTPWPLVSIVEILANSVQHYLITHDCDHHGWENAKEASIQADAWVAKYDKK